MQISIFRKELIFGIIILFIGASVTPNLLIRNVKADLTLVLSFTDNINDVSDATGKKVNRPNIDIYVISCSQDGIVVELKLQLASGGTIQDSELIFYEMILTTDLTLYTADYASGEVLVADELGNDIDVIEYSGVGTNELKISFNLYSSDEVCLNLSSTTFEFSLSEEGYFDEYPNQVEIIEVEIDSPSIGIVGVPVQFYGNADYESPDLEWAWDFGDGGESNQKNPKHTYNESGTFDVTLIVSDPEGLKMGYDETTITISVSVNTIYVPDDYITIQAAVDNANAGNTIIVRDGIYLEYVDVYKSITIKSENGAESTIVSTPDPQECVFLVNASGVTIDGFTIEGATGYWQGSDFRSVGLYAIGATASNIIFCNNIVQDNYYGIGVGNSASNNIIFNNILKNNYYGIAAHLSANNNIIYLNNFINNSYNVYSNSSTNFWNSSVQINYIYNGEKLHIGDCADVYYIGKFINGTVFDTNIESVAIVNGIYNETNPYTPAHVFVDPTFEQSPPNGFENYTSDYIKGFLKGLIGMKEGETKNVTIPPEDAYGIWNESLAEELGMDSIPLDNIINSYVTENITDFSSYYPDVNITVGETFDYGVIAFGQANIINATIIEVTDTDLTYHLSVENGTTILLPLFNWNVTFIVLNDTAFTMHSDIEVNHTFTYGDYWGVIYFKVVEVNETAAKLAVNMEAPSIDFVDQTLIFELQVVNIYKTSQYNFNNYLGNYWDDYIGTDDNDDGIVDQPYSIISGQNDNYPLMEPFENYIIVVDNQLPSKVTGLTVKDAKDGKLSLSWNTATDNVAISHYKIYRDGQFLINVTQTSYQDTGLTNGQTYTYQVSAVDTSGNEGLKSDQKTGKPTKSSSGGGGSTGGGGGPALPPNNIPVANAGGPYYEIINNSITFDGSGSTDSDGTIVSNDWTFGDGTTGKGATPTHSYTTVGNYTIKLIVTDNGGQKASDTTYAIITEKPNSPPDKPTIYGNVTGKKNTDYNYTAVSIDQDNDNIKYIFDWGDETNITVTGFVQNATAYTVMHSWVNSGVYTIKVSAIDEHNSTSENGEFVVLIDAVFCDDIGHILDSDSDGIYEIFHCNSTGNETETQKTQNGNYLIDSNGDGKWDYTYDLTKGLSAYQAEKVGTPGFELILVLCVIIMTILLRKNKRAK